MSCAAAGSITSSSGGRCRSAPYIADFACLDARLIVELDGIQHAESRRDVARDAELERRGFRVLRFWNNEVLRELTSVCDTIIDYARDISLQPWR